ncbi:MAG TPA: (d)CMP kinase [Actinomycetota bacterium]|nr:(d)CMP kinase [Actinomycetota bacterium]
MSRLIVAVDGTAGSGKSTVSRIVATRLGLVHIDTGSTYRLLGWLSIQRGLPLQSAQVVADAARELAGRCGLGPQGVLTFDGAPVGEELRDPEVTRAASVVAAHPEVRAVLVKLQRGLVPPEGAVVEGRDIGTVVWPQAEVKAYLDAHPDTRAERRSGGEAPDAVRERDHRDSTRPVGAMRPGRGAVLIDTSSRSPEQVAEVILERARNRRPRANIEFRLVRGTLSGIARTLFRMEIRGAHLIPSTGPAIIAPNHRSMVDVMAAAALTRRKTWFMSKEELFATRLSSSFFTKMGCFPVRRGRPDRRSLATALSLLARGELLGLFPEGTRQPQARFDTIEEGLAYVALKSGAPVVPVAFSGTQLVLPKGSKVPRLVKLRAQVGEPFVLGGPVRGVLARAQIVQATDESQRRLAEVMDAVEPVTR